MIRDWLNDFSDVLRVACFLEVLRDLEGGVSEELHGCNVAVDLKEFVDVVG